MTNHEISDYYLFLQGGGVVTETKDTALSSNYLLLRLLLLMGCKHLHFADKSNHRNSPDSNQHIFYFIIFAVILNYFAVRLSLMLFHNNKGRVPTPINDALLLS